MFKQNASKFAKQISFGSSSLNYVHDLALPTISKNDNIFFSGASLSKAQSEFATGVMKNDAVRQAAADAAREGVRSQFANAGGQAENRY